MATFDPSKLKKTKLVNVITDLYASSSISEQITFIGRLLDGMNSVQIEALYEICRVVFRKVLKTKKSSSDERGISMIHTEPEIDLQNENPELDFENTMVQQLLNDILAGLPIQDFQDEAKSLSFFLKARPLCSIARAYFLDKSKTQGLGRLRLYPVVNYAASAPGSAKSRKSSASSKLNMRLAESLSIISAEWKNTERLELCAMLTNSSSDRTVKSIHEILILRLKKAINIDSLPDHILLYMFSFLRPTDVSKCSSVCHRWNNLTRSQRLWRFKCIEIGRNYLRCPDISILFTHAVKSRVLRQRLPTISSSEDSNSRIDWRAVCKLVAFNTLRRTETQSLFDREKSTAKTFNFKRKVVVGDEVDVGDFDENDTTPVLPPVRMFTTKAHTKVADENLAHIGKSNHGTDLSTIHIGQAKNAGDANAVGSATARTNIFTQARSVIRPTVPVYPDVEKPLKAAIQEVLDTKVLQGHMGAILCLFFDNVRLYSGGADNTIRLWHPRGGRCLLKFLGHKGGVHALDYCSETYTLYSGSWDTTIRIWDVGQSKAAGIMSGHRGTVTGITVITSSLLLSSSNDGTLKLWNTLGCSCIASCSLLQPPHCELQPLIRLCAFSNLSSFSMRSDVKQPIVSAILCADGSVFITSQKLVASQIDRTNSDRLKAKSAPFIMRWTPWGGLKEDKQLSYQGLALALHGELLIVATYGQRRTQPVIVGHQSDEIRVVDSSMTSVKENVEGGVIWLARFPKLSKEVETSHEDATSNVPHLYSAINLRSMPSALFCAFGKMFVGLVDGSVQLWDLGDLVLIIEFRPHTSRVRDIKASADFVTTCDDDGHVVVSRLSSVTVSNKLGAGFIRR